MSGNLKSRLARIERDRSGERLVIVTQHPGETEADALAASGHAEPGPNDLVIFTRRYADPAGAHP